MVNVYRKAMVAKIRVLHVIGKMNRGGAETFLMELYRHINRNILQFDFLEIQYDYDDGVFDDEIRQLGGAVYKFKMNRHMSPISFYRNLYVFFSDHKEYAIIHSHQYTMSGLILYAAKKCGRKTIAHAHAVRKKGKLDIKELYRIAGVELIKRYSDYYFGCSENALYSLTNMYSNNKKAFIVKNAIDSEKFFFSEAERIIQRKKYGFVDEKVIGCVGRFSTVKNQLFLIKLFAKAIEFDSSLSLVFVGEGEKEEAAKTYAQELGINHRCQFIGVKSDVNNILNMFDAFCLPSLNEGLGIVYIEAQCNGLNCIAPLETVPEEADIGANCLKRVSINAPEKDWVEALLKVVDLPRVDSKTIKKCIYNSGYDINGTAEWLQRFYISCHKGQ